jgi:hypothetical protein
MIKLIRIFFISFAFVIDGGRLRLLPLLCDSGTRSDLAVRRPLALAVLLECRKWRRRLIKAAE